MKDMKTAAAVGALLALTTAIGISAAAVSERRDVSSKSSESSVTTNENGIVSRLFTECTVTTNGNMVTERRRETRTNTDTGGNVLETSTSEFAQSYTVGDVAEPVMPKSAGSGEAPAAANADSFLGLKFGEAFDGGTNLVADAAEPTLMRAEFAPRKPLAGFDDYYVYVTPKTHKVAKVYACAKNAVEPGARWRRHYLIEALEKRYQTWARACSMWRPCYAFDIGEGRYVKACLAGASQDYETVVVAWDDAVLGIAAEEQAEVAAEARKAAAEKRTRRVSDAAEAF